MYIDLYNNTNSSGCDVLQQLRGSVCLRDFLTIGRPTGDLFVHPRVSQPGRHAAVATMTRTPVTDRLLSVRRIDAMDCATVKLESCLLLLAALGG